MPSIKPHENTVVVPLSTADSDVQLVAGTAGWSIHITDIVISVGANAGFVTLQDSDNATVFGPVRLAVDRSLAVSLNIPIKVAKGLALEFDKEAACDEGSVFVAYYLDRDE